MSQQHDVCPNCQYHTPITEVTALTLRDRFAMAALTGMMSDPDFDDFPATDIAKSSYLMADSMLEARKK